MDLNVAAGDKVWLGDKTFVVTEMAADSLPFVRASLLGVARAGGLVTYGELIRDLELGYSPQGVGVVLDVLSVDCIARDEPPLASLVVRGSTLESGDCGASQESSAVDLPPHIDTSDQPLPGPAGPTLRPASTTRKTRRDTDLAATG